MSWAISTPSGCSSASVWAKLSTATVEAWTRVHSGSSVSSSSRCSSTLGATRIAPGAAISW